MFLNTITPPCPALEKQDGIYSCGLVVNTHKYVYPGAVLSDRLYGKIRKYLLKKFEFGVGCDSKMRCPGLASGPSPPNGKNMEMRAVKMVRG